MNMIEKFESFEGYRRKMVQKKTEDLEQIQGPRGSIFKCDQWKSQERPSIYDPHYVWSDFGGVISSTFPHMTLCLTPVLEWGPDWLLQKWTFTLPIIDSYVCLSGLEEFPLHTCFKALNPRLLGETYKKKSSWFYC